MNIDKKVFREFYEAEAARFDHQADLYEVGSKHLVAFCRKRLQIVRDWLDKMKNEGEISTFCDIGTAEGLYLKIARDAFGEQVLAVGGDIALNYLKKAKARTNCEVVLLDAAQLPFGDGSFDVVSCTEVFEHLPDPKRAFAELARISKRFVILSVYGDTIFAKIYVRIFRQREDGPLGDWGHISQIPMKEIRHWASDSQLRIKDFTIHGTLGMEGPRILKMPLFLYNSLDRVSSWLLKKVGIYDLSLGRVMLLVKERE